LCLNRPDLGGFSEGEPVLTAEEHLIFLLAGQGVSGEAAQLALEALPAASTNGQKAVHGLPGGSGRREKVFGMGRPRALDRNAKVRIMHWARCLSRRTEKGRAYGVVTAKALAVLEALLWAFHNAKSGLCFPSYETIAEAAHCARSTVAEAIRALEDAGIMSWVHRLKRVRVACQGLFGDETRTVPQRTSNAYHFTDPSPAGRPVPPKSEKATGTANRVVTWIRRTLA
jgi:Helix-turn-helix domain